MVVKKLIQVRVPEEVHRALKAGAAAHGKGLGAFLVESALGVLLLEAAKAGTGSVTLDDLDGTLRRDAPSLSSRPAVEAQGEVTP